MSTDLKTIIDLHEAWVRSELQGRTDDLVKMCSKDVVIAPPACLPIVGRDAAATFLEKAAAPIESLVINDLSIELFGGMALKRARFATRIVGSIEEVRGCHLWVLRPAWEVAYLTWAIDL